MPGGIVQMKVETRGEKVLAKLSDELRMKYVRRALRETAKIAALESRRNARALKTQGRDRWGKEPLSVTLSQSIKWRLTRTRRAELADSAVVETVTPHPQYAAPVEYGHQMVVFGRPPTGRVQAHPFMRPAIDSTEAVRNRLFWKILREFV